MRNSVARLRELATRASASFDTLPIRTRLAAVSALLTFAILCGFAVLVGFLTTNRLRADFNREVAQSAAQVAAQMEIAFNAHGQPGVRPSLEALAAPEHAIIKLFTVGSVFAEWPRSSPSLGPLTPIEALFGPGPGRALQLATTVDGYQVETLSVRVVFPNGAVGHVPMQYARPVSVVDAAVARVELFLLLGTLAGTGLALFAGTMIARRAMAPITALTSAAAQIARTRDRSLAIPSVAADDEVAELARTLAAMLRELDAAHAETESTLARQRRFVADASHELRTPLTSVLANLELLADALSGEQRDAAQSALRSSQRMRRLVADLLLLARSDLGRERVRRPLDLALVAIDAAAELGPMSVTHEIYLDARPAMVEGSRDELDRVAINLIENALRHTPPGSEIWISTGLDASGHAMLVIEDNGPGVPDELAPVLFERFVRGAGDRGGSFGLGLAIVRAVVQSHGGTVTVERATRKAAHGARFVVMLPAAISARAESRAAATAAPRHGPAAAPGASSPDPTPATPRAPSGAAASHREQ